MVNDVEKRIYELVSRYDGYYLFGKKKKWNFTPETDFDTDLNLDIGEAEELMEEFFSLFNVERGNFKIQTYYPDEPWYWNPFKKPPVIPVPDFTIGMLIESAKAGRWLYD